MTFKDLIEQLNKEPTIEDYNRWQDEEDRLEEYQWLLDNCTETYLYPNRASSEYFPDTRTRWEIPTLICSGPIGGHITLRKAIRIAMEKAKCSD